MTSLNRCREYWRKQKKGLTFDRENRAAAEAFLIQFADPSSEFSLLWDQEHDRYVVQRIFALVKREFEANEYAIFKRYTLDGESPAALAKEYGVAIGQVYKIKFRVLKRLREEAKDLVNIPDFGD